MRVKDININYVFSDNKKDETIVFLHGWGQNIAMMEPLAKYYPKYFNTLIIDLPGFGKSDEPKEVWDTKDYVLFVHELINKLNLTKIILIGHSFGGRIALLYASMYPVKKLICLASPYCPEVSKISFKTKAYKKVKNIKCLKFLANYLRKKNGSADYNNASEIMKGVLVKAVNTNLQEDVKNIKCPTLLVWGDLDTAVPIKRAYELKNLIKNAGVVVFNGATHYAYLERINELVIVLDNFLEVNRK